MTIVIRDGETIEQTVIEFLNAAEVTFTATYRGLKKDAMGDKGNSMDQWDTSFTLRDGRAAHEEFEFFTGLGLRAEATAKQKQAARYDVPGVTENDTKRNTIYGRRYLAAVDAKRSPKAPSAASVLQSLISDSEAGSETFDSWCENFGYDSDSRKAFAIYEACQKSADKLRRVFNAQQIAQLSELLQDY